MGTGYSAARYYGKLALAMGVPFGALMALFAAVSIGLVQGWSEALKFGAITFIGAGAAFGIAMSLILGSLARRATEDLGPGALEVRQHDEVVVAGDAARVLVRVAAALRALPKKNEVTVNESVGTATANTGKTWQSFGERVIARVERMDEGCCSVRITSVPKVKKTLVDYGANRRNVMHVVAFLSQPT